MNVKLASRNMDIDIKLLLGSLIYPLYAFICSSWRNIYITSKISQKFVCVERVRSAPIWSMILIYFYNCFLCKISRFINFWVSFTLGCCFGICLGCLFIIFHPQQLPFSDAVRLIHGNEFPSPILCEKLCTGTTMEIVNDIKYNCLMVL